MKNKKQIHVKDPIDLEIKWQRLVAIMDEIDNATIKTAFSTIVSDSHDFACILLDSSGNSICQSSFSPPDFCVIIPSTARKIINKIGKNNINDGDVLVTNDPWIAAGHLPDYAILTPIFFKRKLIGFIGTIAHLADVGGHNGDIIANDVYTEGLCIPPSKLVKKNTENKFLFNIISCNTRVPDLVIGDLRAIIGTHKLGKNRIEEFFSDYRLNNFVNLSGIIRGSSEDLLRNKIYKLKNGTYKYNLNIDGYFDIVTLNVKIEISDYDIFVDYTGSSLQTNRASINCVYNVTHSSTMYPFKCALVPNIPNNTGLFKPINVFAPKGSILNTTFPHPVQARAKTTNNINQVIFGALSDVFGEYAQAGSGSIWPFSVFGTDDNDNTFSCHILPHGGRGAMKNMDGLIPIAFPHNSVVTPIEVMELKSPVIFEMKKLIPNSGGPGKYRGGLSQQINITNISGKTIKARIRPDKIICEPKGLNKGMSGIKGRVIYNGLEIREFPIFDFKPNDKIELILPGGAGCGNPKFRNKENIKKDLELGYITAEHCKLYYQ